MQKIKWGDWTHYTACAGYDFLSGDKLKPQTLTCDYVNSNQRESDNLYCATQGLSGFWDIENKSAVCVDLKDEKLPPCAT